MKDNLLMITEAEYRDMFSKCSKIRKLLLASITTAKSRKENGYV